MREWVNKCATKRKRERDIMKRRGINRETATSELQWRHKKIIMSKWETKWQACCTSGYIRMEWQIKIRTNGFSATRAASWIPFKPRISLVLLCFCYARRQPERETKNGNLHIFSGIFCCNCYLACFSLSSCSEWANLASVCYLEKVRWKAYASRKDSRHAKKKRTSLINLILLRHLKGLKQIFLQIWCIFSIIW